MSGTDIEVYDPDDEPDGDLDTTRLPLIDGRDPWEKQGDDETLKQYEAFVVYRDLGYSGNTVKVAEELGKSTALIQRWSRRNRWVERREAYLLWRERRRRQEIEGEQDRANRLHGAAGQSMVTLGIRRIRGDEAAGVAALDPNEMGAADVARFMDVGVRIHRTSLGLATDFVKGLTSVPGADATRVMRLLFEAAITELEKETPNVDSFLLRVDEIGRMGQ